MKNEQINVFEDMDALCLAFTNIVQDELAKKETVTISLSGGSTPKVLFQYWADNCRESIDWHRLVFFWGDERCVSPTDEMSNFGMTKHLLFDQIPTIDRKVIHRIHGENDPEEECLWYNKIINEYVPKNKKDIPAFDLMMLGMGDDGHTISIFPNQIHLWDASSNCVVAEHPETQMKRVSMTGKLVNNASNIIFLVTGQNKAEKVKQITEERDKYQDRYPAAKVVPLSGKLFWFLDQKAASLL